MGIKSLAKLQEFSKLEKCLVQSKGAKEFCGKAKNIFEKKANNLTKIAKGEISAIDSEAGRALSMDELRDLCLDLGFAPEAKLRNMNMQELTELFAKGKIKKENSFLNACGRKLTTKEKESITRVSNKMITDLMTNMGKYTKGISVPSLSENFVIKKGLLLNEMRGILSPSRLKRIEKAKTPEELTHILFSEEWKSYDKLMKVQSSLPKGRTLLEFEQMDYAARVQRGRFIIAREKALVTPSTNPTVVNIERTLKDKYGVEFVSLNNDEKMAKKVLKGFETASKANAPLPKNVIVSDFMIANGENIFTENTVLLQSNFAQRLSMEIQGKTVSKMSKSDLSILNLARFLESKTQVSTGADEHIVVHEIMHGTHPCLNSFAQKKIPAQFLPIKEKISLYSAISPTHETYTELAAKRAIEGLNAQETELFNYLNFYG